MPAENVEKEISVFRNGRSQAVRIPKEFEIDADRVVISRQSDGSLILRPRDRKLTLLEALDRLKMEGPIEDFPGDPGDTDLAPLDDIEL